MVDVLRGEDESVQGALMVPCKHAVQCLIIRISHLLNMPLPFSACSVIPYLY